MLTESVRRFLPEPDWWSGDEHVARWNGHEEDIKFVIPKKTKKIIVRVEYVPSWGEISAFKEMFGYDAQSVGMETHICKSSDCVAWLEDGAP